MSRPRAKTKTGPAAQPSVELNDAAATRELVEYGVGPEVAPEIDEARMADKPADVSETQWRARLAYDAVQQAQAGDPEHLTRDHNYDARQAANAVLREAIDNPESA